MNFRNYIGFRHFNLSAVLLIYRKILESKRTTLRSE